jgi:hypothetical protein
MRNQINTIAEKINDQVTEQVTTATKNYTETNDRVLDAIVDTNRKAVDLAVKTFDQINDRIADQAPTFELPFDMPKMDRFEVPTAAEAGKRYIDAVERMAEMNRDFSERVVAMLPTEKPVIKPAAKATKAAVAKKPAAKKTAKKAPARKAAAKK